MQLAEHGTFLLLMGPHAAENVVQNAHRGDDIRTLVEHDARGALAHSGVRDFGSLRHARLRERFQDLRRPDHGQIRSLADPQDFLLNFREALVAAFDGEIASNGAAVSRLRSR
jgi:hypothetical protein